LSRTSSGSRRASASRKICEDHRRDASQKMTENRRMGASQKIYENHPRAASQKNSENQPTTAKFSRMRTLVEIFYDAEDLRIRTEARLRALGEDLKVPNEDVRGIFAVLSWLRSAEKSARKEIEMEVKNEELWKQYLSKINGIGPILAAGLIGYIEDIERFETVSKLWAYAGLHVVEGKAPRRRRGQKINWNPKLRVLCWKIGESFVKMRGGGGYRDLYEKHRAEYEAREDLKKEAKGRRYAMAKRKTVKIFLSHLWEVWRRLESLPIRRTYVEEKLGHKDIIEPFIDTGMGPRPWEPE